MLLATPEDIEQRLGRELDPAEQRVYTGLLADVSALITAYCRCDFAYHHREIFTVPGVVDQELVLPVRHLRTVWRVACDGQPIHGWRLAAGSLWRRAGWGPVSIARAVDARPGGGLVPYGPIDLDVTATWGYERVPADVVAACVAECIRTQTMKPGVRSERVGDLEVTYATGTGAELSPGAKAALHRYRIAFRAVQTRRS